ncbi:DUF1847 domain-containing protein [Methanobacterium petrolearium]|uniref:DUF1847 domain-containing protein n=1 Tax=Methanobacterium petrolearium TaxID=710190 RepID=UPI001AE7F4B4|nr:DUF1847 domain-containing protein [Methanobacterium petrolearium]BDZ71856.1 hypothetical protein GCM10025861_23730 [Methanobacterium petrolearium]
MNCASCQKKDCYNGKDCLDIKEEVKKLYKEHEIDVLKKSTAIESRYYMEKTRIEEIIIFSKMMKYKKIGLAFCVGLEEEANILHSIFKKHFKVYSVCCKVCGINKKDFQLEKIDNERRESMCNPIGQATVLNEKDTDLNIIIGLCIGHDILFTEHSQAPVTTLAVKDRVLAHNPLGAIYSKYYLNKF